MEKEPIGLYLLKLFLSISLFILLVMLYWSSTIIEENLISVKGELVQIKAELGEIQKLKMKPAVTIAGSNNTVSSSSQVDESLPNLLTEDIFYKTTLPQMLGPNFQPLGTLHGAVLGKPDSLHPFSNWSHISAWLRMCTVTVGRLHVGKYETLAPDMAFKMEERLNPSTQKREFWVHLRKDVYWFPLRPEWFSGQVELNSHFLKKHPVTAHDFKFFFDAMMNPHVSEGGAVALRTYYSDIESVEVIDDSTFVVRWKHGEVLLPDGSIELKPKYMAKSLTAYLQPLASFVYKYFADGTKIVEDDADPETYRKNSVWAQNFTQHWAKNIIPSCGAWLFEGKTDRQIRFKRNPDFYAPLAVLVDANEVHFKETLEAVWQMFKANQLDTYEIRPTQLQELEEFLQSDLHREQKEMGSGVRQLQYFARTYAYIGWNEARDLFKSKRVRQALTMAIDRQRIIRQNLNNLGIEINGPFAPDSPSYDKSIAPWPYDVQRAKRILEEEGWYDSEGDGVIDKEVNGTRLPFQFKLTYYVKNNTSKAISEYISTALKEVGIQSQLHGVDITDLSAVFDDKNFDALALGWALGAPPEDPKQLWHSSGSKEKGSSNAIGFANAEADKIIEALQYESDPKKRIELYHAFDHIMHEEAPYTFLYAPKTILLYREYLQNVFILSERQDLIPGANIGEPDPSIFWIKKNV